MKTTCFLKINKHEDIKVTKRPTDIQAGYVGFEIELEIPDEAFEMPLIKVEMAVPGSAVYKPEVKAKIIDREVKGDCTV